jgi:hypothetical protein
MTGMVQSLRSLHKYLKSCAQKQRRFPLVIQMAISYLSFYLVREGGELGNRQQER